MKRNSISSYFSNAPASPTATANLEPEFKDQQRAVLGTRAMRDSSSTQTQQRSGSATESVMAEQMRRASEAGSTTSESSESSGASSGPSQRLGQRAQSLPAIPAQRTQQPQPLEGTYSVVKGGDDKNKRWKDWKKGREEEAFIGGALEIAFDI